MVNGKLFQVLSSTVGMELRVGGYNDLSEFILKIDYWFHLLNTGLRDGKSKNKPHMEPYCDPCDDRLEWLTSFLGITKQRYLKLRSPRACRVKNKLIEFGSSTWLGQECEENYTEEKMTKMVLKPFKEFILR